MANLFTPPMIGENITMDKNSRTDKTSMKSKLQTPKQKYAFSETMLLFHNQTRRCTINLC
jgi:hypothetical protein